MAYRQRYPKKTMLATAAVSHAQFTGRGPGNIGGLENRGRVTGYIRPGTWTYPRQPILRVTGVPARTGEAAA